MKLMILVAALFAAPKPSPSPQPSPKPASRCVPDHPEFPPGMNFCGYTSAAGGLMAICEPKTEG